VTTALEIWLRVEIRNVIWFSCVKQVPAIKVRPHLKQVYRGWRKVNVAGCKMMPYYENGQKDIRVDDLTGRPNTSVMDIIAARTKKLSLYKKGNTWKVASTTKRRK
jgi:hypothetical protein